MTFAAQGYAAIPGLLAPGELTTIREQVGVALDAPRGAACERPHNTLVPLRWADPVVASVLGSPTRRQRIGEAVGAADLRWISAYVSVKEPHSPPLWWHQDWWCWEHPVSFAAAAPQVAVLCYLAPTDETRAALRVIPGSHRSSLPLHADLPEAHATTAGELSPEHPALADHPDQVTLSLAAGDAAAIDYRLLHGTHANRSADHRDCLLLTFAPNWAALPTEVRGHLIQHTALPQEGERWERVPGLAELLPRYAGPRRDLPLNRNAPPSFALAGDR